jgi:3-isopropylmalate/(R)-2-methylmalate dehydratase large subunit
MGSQIKRHADHGGSRHHVGRVEVFHGIDGLVSGFKLDPSARTLVLYDDAAQIAAQLDPAALHLEQLPPDDAMIRGVSTDAIIAARPDCYQFDTASLGMALLRTLQVGGVNPIPPEAIAKGNFGALAAGADWGCGSSREHAALALLGAGIGAVYAPSIAPIHLDNLIANGMVPFTDRALFERFMQGELITVDDLVPSLTPFQSKIVRRGNVFRFMRAWAEGKEPIDQIETDPRPMTIVEKIMATNMDTANGSVKPGDAGMLRVTTTLCHDYTTAQIDAMIREGLGRPPQVAHPDKHWTFADHLELMQEGQAGATAEEIAAVTLLRQAQAQVAQETGIHFPQRQGGGSTGICHQYIRENVVQPGQVIVGTDSHTCAAGFANAYAFGVGSSPLAIAWEHDVTQATVPETIRIEFSRELPPSVSGKDIMLFLAHMAKGRAGRSGEFTGRVLQYGGEGLKSLTADDQWVLTNMATECSAKTGIVEPNEVLTTYLVDKRGMSPEEVQQMIVYPDERAEYADVIKVDLATVVPAVSKPGHTGNMVPLNDVAHSKVDMAYSGSCTAGSYEILLRLAEILSGKVIVIPMHVQAGSDAVLQQARERGIIDLLKASGVTMIDVPGCGACLAAGPGGPEKGKTVISTTNRNFAGRMGDGDAFLANVGVVATTALLGRIPTMEEYILALEGATDLGHLKERRGNSHSVHGIGMREPIAHRPSTSPDIPQDIDI